MSEISVLVVDDDDESRGLLITLLETLGFRVKTARSGAEALALLLPSGGTSACPPDVAILDVMMPGMDGLEVLRRYRDAGGRQPVIFVSAIDDASTALAAVRLGANDYMTKPFNPDELREILDRVVGDAGQPQHVHAPAPPLAAGPLGTSPAMRRVAELVERIADVDVPILITGESGVGKDVVAREIHTSSTRKDRVFVKINCAALPGELLESELFGHERGSFTGAARTKPGQFELADGGTLFLDEIGEMPVSLQAKLLQALQDGEFYRVGGQRKIRVDARVICATNRDLDRAIREGTFREDLYYRLNVVHLNIPPLRDRRDDIPSLIEHFVEKYGKRYGRAIEIPPVVMARFLSYDWPGNIRELENLVRRLMVLRDPSYVLEELRDRAPIAANLVAAVPVGAVAAQPGIAGFAGAPQAWASAPAGIPGAPALVGTTVDGELRIDLKEVGRQAAHVAEREAIVTMLGHTGGNKREAAERLGISYKAILYKIREFGIGRPRIPRRAPRRDDHHASPAAGAMAMDGSPAASLVLVARDGTLRESSTGHGPITATGAHVAALGEDDLTEDELEALLETEDGLDPGPA